MPYSCQNPTIGEINQKLATLKLPELNPDTSKALVEAAGNDKRRVLEAIIRAADQGHQNSLRWLKNLLEKIGLPCQEPDPAQVRPQPAAAPSPAPAQNHARPVQAASSTATVNDRDVATQSDSESSAQPGTEQTRHYSVHAYASNHALCLEPDTNRSNERTVSIDAATAIGERVYDWENKTRVQLTARELALMAAMLCGFVRHVRFDQRGQTGKGLTAERQVDKEGNLKVFVRVRGPNGLYAVPVEAFDVYRFRQVFLSQLTLGYLDAVNDSRVTFLDALEAVTKNLRQLGAEMKSLHEPMPAPRQRTAEGQ